MANCIFQLETVHLPGPTQIAAAMKLVVDAFGGNDWFISEPPENGRNLARTTPLSDQALVCACERAPRISYGVHDYSFSCGSPELKIHVAFDRIKLDRMQWRTILKHGGVQTSAVHLHFSGEPNHSIAQLMYRMAEILVPFYGRVFVPRDTAKRVSGSYHTLGGLPGLHPINFFGAGVAERLNIQAAENLAGVEVRKNGAGVLLEFLGRTAEFNRSELATFQSELGEACFRGIASESGGARHRQVIPWLIGQLLAKRRHEKDRQLFDCDLTPLFT